MTKVHTYLCQVYKRNRIFHAQFLGSNSRRAWTLGLGGGRKTEKQNHVIQTHGRSNTWICFWWKRVCDEFWFVLVIFGCLVCDICACFGNSPRTSTRLFSSRRSICDYRVRVVRRWCSDFFHVHLIQVALRSSHCVRKENAISNEHWLFKLNAPLPYIASTYILSYFLSDNASYILFNIRSYLSSYILPCIIYHVMF